MDLGLHRRAFDAALTAMQTFARAAEMGSFSRAAESMRLPAQLNSRIQELLPHLLCPTGDGNTTA